jgi:hypothetical protein
MIKLPPRSWEEEIEAMHHIAAADLVTLQHFAEALRVIYHNSSQHSIRQLAWDTLCMKWLPHSPTEEKS